VGSDRQGVSTRDRRGKRLAGRPLPRALAAPRLPLHVRARLHGRVSVLLGDRGRVRRLRRPPGEPRRHAFGGVAGASREAAGVQAADGLELPLGVLGRRGLQLRLQRLAHREATARGGRRIQLPARAGVGGRRDRGLTDETRRGACRRARGHDRYRRGHGVVYHAYSTYARGLDGLWGMYQWLDRAPKGRNETGTWWRRHDEYNKG
jgi:hypothetical protein